MKNLLLIIFIFFSTLTFGQTVDYKALTSAVKTEISVQKALIKSIKTSLKIDKNSVELHKKLVYAQADLQALKVKEAKIKTAKKLYNKLIKENKRYDAQKVKLLELKRQSEELDNELLKK